MYEYKDAYSSKPVKIGKSVSYRDCEYTLSEIQHFDEGKDSNGDKYCSYTFVYEGQSYSKPGAIVSSCEKTKAGEVSIGIGKGEGYGDGYTKDLEVSLGTKGNILAAEVEVTIDTIFEWSDNNVFGTQVELTYNLPHDSPLGEYFIQETQQVKTFLSFTIEPELNEEIQYLWGWTWLHIETSRKNIFVGYNDPKIIDVSLYEYVYETRYTLISPVVPKGSSSISSRPFRDVKPSPYFFETCF